MDETRATLLMRLGSDGAEREVAWATFCRRYEPVIAGFARSMGATAQETSEIVQDVVTGFFAVQPRFVYDPGKGRLRGYLRACVLNAIQGRARGLRAGALGEIDPSDPQAERRWDDAWERRRLEEAMDRVREHYRDGRRSGRSRPWSCTSVRRRRWRGRWG